MKKSAYFYVVGLIKETGKECNLIDLNVEKFYDVFSYGVSKTYSHCKKVGIDDLFTNPQGERRLLPNSFLIVYKIDLNDSEYNSIDEANLAEFDILKKILDNQNQIVYDIEFKDDGKFTEYNFSQIKEGLNE